MFYKYRCFPFPFGAWFANTPSTAFHSVQSSKCQNSSHIGDYYLLEYVPNIEASAVFLLRVKWLTKTFFSSDVISFLVQGTGSGMMSMGGSMASTAKRITIAGLVIQLVMFGLFIVTSVIF